MTPSQEVNGDEGFFDNNGILNVSIRIDWRR